MFVMHHQNEALKATNKFVAPGTVTRGLLL
jgi:hypothetical protein